jgi:hypothetical protein
LKSRQKEIDEEIKGKTALQLMKMYLRPLALEKRIAPIRGEHSSLKGVLVDTQEQLTLCQEWSQSFCHPVSR